MTRRENVKYLVPNYTKSELEDNVEDKLLELDELTDEIEREEKKGAGGKYNPYGDLEMGWNEDWEDDQMEKDNLKSELKELGDIQSKSEDEE